jgi:FKBP-type peptidyl-prolyl cis-trans isomerase SlyD
MDVSKATVKEDLVVSLEYVLTVDGQVVDQSEAGDPIQFIQGRGEIIAGLESALYGMAVGERKHVQVESDEAYGEHDPDAFGSVPLSAFPDNVPVEIGTELELEDDQGHLVPARITAIGSGEAQLDFNHPLAGKVLSFDIAVVDVRAATPEELAHGHVHAHGSHSG